MYKQRARYGHDTETYVQIETHMDLQDLAMMGEPRGFIPVAAGFLSYNGELREPLVFPRKSNLHSRCEG